MFAEDLQADIYNGSPAVAILFLFSHRQAPHRSPAFAVGAPGPDGHDGPARSSLFQEKKAEYGRRDTLDSR